MSKEWVVTHGNKTYTFQFTYTTPGVPDKWAVLITEGDKTVQGTMDDFYQLARFYGPEDLVVFYNKRNDYASAKVRGYNKKSLFDD